MAKRRSVYACTQCGSQQPRWLGRCPECESWNTLVEEPVGGPPGLEGPGGPEVGDAAARVEIKELLPPAERAVGEILGEGPDAVPELVRRLREEAKAL